MAEKNTGFKRMRKKLMIMLCVVFMLCIAVSCTITAEEQTGDASVTLTFSKEFMEEWADLHLFDAMIPLI